MRIYLPLTARELSAPHISARLAHGVTPALQSAVPEENDEGYELISSLAAADDSLRLIGNSDDECLRRIVVAADVDTDLIGTPASGSQTLPTQIMLLGEISWDKVAAIHVDEPGFEELVRAAIAGDEAAFVDTGDIDMLWYDPTELEQLIAELNQ
ncbi:MAG: hypothetical protein GX483_05690 [Actinomycetaceae bacterium]|nr:hypothetical protein [Actinomycetaceae bacterium]